MRRVVFSLLFVLVGLLSSTPAQAGTWGESSGSMGWLAGGLLVGLLVRLGRWRGPEGRVPAAALLFALGVAPGVAAQVSVPNTFANGSVAQADAMSANFTAVEEGVNAALTTGSVTVPYAFTNGTTANAEEVNANFATVVGGVNTALANRETDCLAAGGSWNGVTSICTAAVVSNYNCFVGGFCSQTAIDFDPASIGYVNVYAGDNQGAGDALAAGCNTPPGSLSWVSGENSPLLPATESALPRLGLMCEH